MADSLNANYGSSYEYNDPFCEPCSEGKGLDIKVHSYCKDCFQFLCSDCSIIHRNLQVSRHHVILHGASMPQSQADKPPKFGYCDRHQTLVKDKFCSAHKTLICSACVSSHINCVVETVADVCKTVKSSETNLLYAKVRALHDQGMSVLLSVHENIKQAREQKKQMLKETRELYDKVMSKLNKLFQDMQSEIVAAYQSQALVLSQHQDRIDDIVSRLESSLSNIEKLRGKSVDTKLFLKIQESVTDTNQITNKLRSLNESLLFAELSLIPSKTVEDISTSTFTIGSVLKSYVRPYSTIRVSKIHFPGYAHAPVLPQLSQQNLGATGPSTKASVPLRQMKAVKAGTYRVTVKDDKYNCDITGLTIAKDGRRLMTDRDNRKVKLLSNDTKFLSSVSIPGRPYDIVVISDEKAVVTTDKQSLVILDISGSQLSIKTTTQLSYDVLGISRYKSKLIVTSPDSNPPSVKLVDQTGRVYWSVSSDQQGQPLFICPWYVSSHWDGRSSIVIVADQGNDTLTLLKGESGAVITRRQLKGRKEPIGVTTDSAGNVYVCYWRTSEVAVLSEDLLEEKILLSRQDGLSGHPRAIAYDDATHQLAISYLFPYIVDCFQLS